MAAVVAPVQAAQLAIEGSTAVRAARAQAALPRLDAPAVSKQDAALRSALQDFESVFLSMIWQRLRDTVPTGGLLGGTASEKLFRSMLDDEMSKEMSKAGGIGLAKMMYKQMAPQVLSSTPPAGRLA